MRILQIRPPMDVDTRFNCPICSANSLCDIYYMKVEVTHIETNARMIVCRACGQGSIWRQFDREDNYNYSLRLIDPILSDAPSASDDMPEDVKADYEEACLVVNYSTRAAAALLRLSLQKLCRHLGEPGKHIDTDIRSLAKKPEFGERIIKAADTLRIVGNNAVHPGEMNENDIDNICNGLFDLLNLIVDFGITKPKCWDAMYNSLPGKQRKDAEKKDIR
jgi:transcription elongation factor Elf1